MSNSDGGGGRPSIKQLYSVAQDGVELMRLELRLARQETIEKLTPAAQSSGMILGGGLLAAFGSRYLADGIVRLLATRMPHWVASLAFGSGLTIGGLALARQGSREIQDMTLIPEKTIRSLKEDKAWLLHQIKSWLI